MQRARNHLGILNDVRSRFQILNEFEMQLSYFSLHKVFRVFSSDLLQVGEVSAEAPLIEAVSRRVNCSARLAALESLELLLDIVAFPTWVHTAQIVPVLSRKERMRLLIFLVNVRLQ